VVGVCTYLSSRHIINIEIGGSGRRGLGGEGGGGGGEWWGWGWGESGGENEVAKCRLIYTVNRLITQISMFLPRILFKSGVATFATASLRHYLVGQRLSLTRLSRECPWFSKKSLKLPMAHIALAVGRNKKAIYRALDKKAKLLKRARPESLTRHLDLAEHDFGPLAFIYTFSPFSSLGAYLTNIWQIFDKYMTNIWQSNWQ